MNGAIEDEALRLDNFDIDTVERVVVSIRPAHGVAPSATRPDVHFQNPGSESVRAPPLRDVLWIGPHLKDEIAGRVEIAGQNQLPFWCKSGTAHESLPR